MWVHLCVLMYIVLENMSHGFLWVRLLYTARYIGKITCGVALVPNNLLE